jgi:transcriptional regulator with XRE-family HTH domain
MPSSSETSPGAVDEVETDYATQPALGQRLRQIRKDRRLSLNAVATGTDISASFLAAVEKGRNDITLGRLMRLLSYYGVGLGELLYESPMKDQRVVRRGEEKHVGMHNEGIEALLLAADTNRKMMPLLSIFEPGAKRTGVPGHDGETFVHVLDGTFLFELAGRPPVVLHEGDTIYYRKPRPGPVATNLSERTGRLFATISPPR